MTFVLTPLADMDGARRFPTACADRLGRWRGFDVTGPLGFGLEPRNNPPTSTSFVIECSILVDEGPLITLENRYPFLPRDDVVIAFVGKSDDRTAVLGFIERRSATTILGPPDDLFVFYGDSNHGSP